MQFHCLPVSPLGNLMLFINHLKTKMPWSFLSSAVIQRTLSKDVLLFPKCPIIIKTELYWNTATVVTTFIANANESGGRRGDNDAVLTSGQRTIQDFRDDATFLPLLCLVHNCNSRILSSFLIFYPSHAVHSGIELYVLITILFLLNIPNFKLFPHIQMPVLNFKLYCHFKGKMNFEATYPSIFTCIR